MRPEPRARVRPVPLSQTPAAHLTPLSDRIVARQFLSGDPPQLGERLERGAPAETPEAVGLHPAERHLRLDLDGRVIDVAAARLDALSELERGGTSSLKTAADRPYSVSLAARTASPHPIDRHHGDDRTEGLLGIQAHVWRDAREHGGREARPVGCAAAQGGGALLDRVLDQPADALDRGLVDERPDRGALVARIADDSARVRSASLSVSPDATARSTTTRSVDMQIWPWWKNAPKLAAAAARSRSASASKHLRRVLLEHHHWRVAAEPAFSAMIRPNFRRAREVDPPRGRVRDQLVDDVGGVLRAGW